MDIGVAIFFGETKTFGEVRANLVAVQKRNIAAIFRQTLDQPMSDRRFS